MACARKLAGQAIDFSSSAVVAALEQLGEYTGVVEQADFFAYRLPFETDWIYERAFLCALPRDRWQDYAVRMAELLRPGALLAGFHFLGETPKGPSMVCGYNPRFWYDMHPRVRAVPT